jgi:hypothetical protein
VQQIRREGAALACAPAPPEHRLPAPPCAAQASWSRAFFGGRLRPPSSRRSRISYTAVRPGANGGGPPTITASLTFSGWGGSRRGSGPEPDGCALVGGAAQDVSARPTDPALPRGCHRSLCRRAWYVHGPHNRHEDDDRSLIGAPRPTAHAERPGEEERVAALQAIVERLPAENQLVLAYVTHLLHEVPALALRVRVLADPSRSLCVPRWRPRAART